MAALLGITSLLMGIFAFRYGCDFNKDLIARFTRQDHVASRAIAWLAAKRPSEVLEFVVVRILVVSGIFAFAGMMSFFVHQNHLGDLLLAVSLPLLFLSFCVLVSIHFIRELLESLGENIMLSFAMLAVLYIPPFLFGSDVRHPSPWPFIPTINEMFLTLHVGINIYSWSLFWQSIAASTFILVGLLSMPAMLMMLGAAPLLTGIFAVFGLKWLGIKCEKYCPSRPITALCLLTAIVTGISAYLI